MSTTEILDCLRMVFYDHEIREEALKRIQSNQLYDNDSFWALNAVNAWTYWDLDNEDLILFFGDAVKHLLPNTEEPLQR
jgi:hypothetical protein